MFLVLYDHKCPLCNRAVLFILKNDSEKKFAFAPLGGKTAHIYTKKTNSVVLIQKNQKPLFNGKAALKILWLIGGKYKVLGALSFLPGFISYPFYALISKFRFLLFKKQKFVNPKDYEGRFLP